MYINSKKLALSNTELKKELDKLWADLVKERAGHECEKCRKKDYLNSHHIYSRTNYPVRWDERNGVCLCAGCHTLTNTSAHKSPLDFMEWIRAKRGETWYKTLQLKANTITKNDKKLLKLYLEIELQKQKDKNKIL